MAETQGTSGFGTLLKMGDGGVGAGTQASRTISTSNQQIIFKAKNAGTYGNSLTVEIIVSGNNTAFALSVSETAIVVTSATDGSAVATTTVNELLYQLMQNDTFAEFWEATRGAGNGTGVLAAASSAALSGGTLGTEAFTTVAEITNISGPNIKLDLIDATHMESPNAFREYIPSLLDGGELQFDVNYLPSDDNQSALRQAQLDRVRKNFRIYWTDADGSIDRFAGYVTDFNPSAQIDDKLKATCSIKITGDIQRVED